MFNWLKNLFVDKTFGAVRSSQWGTVRNIFLTRNPACAICGSKKNLVVHHKKPFYLFPELELSSDNLVTLCEGNMNCHLVFGHLGWWRKYNPEIDGDLIIWNKKLQ